MKKHSIRLPIASDAILLYFIRALRALRRNRQGVDMVERVEVEKAINEVRPSLQADGGDVELVDVTPDGVVKVKLTGACSGCPMSQMTLNMGIERYLKKQFPELQKVESVQ